MRTFGFEKLNVWHKAKDLVLDIYRITNDFPKEELYTLTSQLRRAAISIPSNLAEGTSRIPTMKWFGTPNYFESSIYSREKVGRSPNLFGSGIRPTAIKHILRPFPFQA